MDALGFYIIVSSPIWMVFICVYADADRTEAARRLWWAGVILLVSGWAIYGLPDTPMELFVAGLATLVSFLLAMWALYAINTERSEEDVILNVAETIESGKATRDDG